MGIATPVCALVRNDRLGESLQKNCHSEERSDVGIPYGFLESIVRQSPKEFGGDCHGGASTASQ